MEKRTGRLGSACAVAIAGLRVSAFVVGVEATVDGTARAVYAAPHFDCTACFTESAANHIATDVIDAEVAEAVAVRAARCTKFTATNTRTVARFVRTCAGHSGVKVVLVDRDIGASASQPRQIAGHARRVARAVATNAIGADATEAIGNVCGARGAILVFAGAAAVARDVQSRAYTHGEIVVVTKRNGGASAERAGHVATHAGVGTRGVAAEVINAIAAETIGSADTRNALIELANADAIARAVGAFIVGIGVRDNGTARAVSPLPLDSIRARLARARARGIAANGIDAVAAHAMRSRAACRAIGKYRYARGPRAEEPGKAIGIAGTCCFACGTIAIVRRAIDDTARIACARPVAGVRVLLGRTRARLRGANGAG